MIDEQTERNVRYFLKSLSEDYIEKSIYLKGMDFDTVPLSKILDAIGALNKHIKELMNDKTRDHMEVFDEVSSLQNVFVKITSNPSVSYALLQDGIAKATKYTGGNN